MDRTWRRFALAVVALVGFAVGGAWACPFCGMQNQSTLTVEVNQASVVVYGTLANARLDPNGAFGQGTTELRVEGYVKKSPALGEPKLLLLPRYLPVTGDAARFVFFCDVFKGKIDPYRGVPVKAGSDLVSYLQGAIALKDREPSVRLRYFFDHLDSADLEVATDAYKEFANAGYKDLRAMASNLPADKIAAWLADPNTASYKYGLFASMLGHCGNARHADLLRKMLDDPSKRVNSGVDGIIAGYVLLKPQEGWSYVRAILRDPTKEFMLRFAALRATRFFIDFRPEVVPPGELLDGVALLLDQADIADLAIEDLRKWQRWDFADRILALDDKKSHDIPIMHRTILRYALACPQPQAKAFVERMRKKDPETVKDVEELLKLETPVAPPKALTGQAP